MKRVFSLGSLLAALAVVVLLAAVPGCPKEKEKTVAKVDGGGDGGKTDGGKTGDGKKEKAEALVVKKFDGVIKGKVVYDGTAPTMKASIVKEDHADAKLCDAGPHGEQLWLVSKDGGVANVVVFLDPPAGKFFGGITEVGFPDVVIDQPYCVYEPHVVAVCPALRGTDGELKKTGQKVIVKNSGGLSHNTKITGDPKIFGDGWNNNLNPKDTVGKEVPVKFQKKPLDVVCDKHTWMTAKILTFDHPFFAVTDKDGNFEIKNVPTDVEVTVKMWHESPGFVTDEKTTFKKGDNKLPLKIKVAP